MSQEEPRSNETVTNDNEIVEPSTYLETEKNHKDWYQANQMGGQRNRPQMVPRDAKKPKGTKKHSTRKES